MTSNGGDIRDQLAAEIAAGRRYDVLLVDPPYPHRSGYDTDPAGTGRYRTLSEDALIDLPVGSVAATPSVCWLWTPGMHLELAMALLGYWGFRYSTVALVWIKLQRNGWQRWVRPGYETCPGCEFVLLGRRGKRLHRYNTAIRQPLEAPIREHSRKPDEAHQRIERLYGPDVRRLELFGRQRRAGWTVLGNEVDRFAEMPTQREVTECGG